VGLKAKGNVKLLALKVVAVAYERWSLTKGSKDSDLTGTPRKLRRGGRCGEGGKLRLDGS